MKTSMILTIGAGLSLVGGSLAAGAAEQSLAQLVAEDVKHPVRPGGVNGQPFWNANAVWFMYPPSFDFPVTKGASCYRFRVFAADGKTHDFWEDAPTATLEPVWGELPVGKTDVWCEACGGRWPSHALARSFRSFYKMAAYEPGGYKPAPRSYADAVRLGYGYLLGLPSLKKFAETGKPDPDYPLNCYPSKIHAAVIRAMVTCARRDPVHRDAAIKLAKAAGVYLLSIALSDGTPLAGFTPTYEGEKMTAKRYAGQNMLDYPCGVGSAFLLLHETTGETKYLKAAEMIAATYLRLQGDDGTWYLKLWEKDGTPVNPNRLHPLGVIDFMERMYAVTKRDEYRTSADRAFGFIEKGPLTDWNWEGQFEDQDPREKYVNLTKHPACATAIHIIERWPDDTNRVAQARELLRFAEDQFVCWRRPMLGDSSVPVNFLSLEIEDWFSEPGAVEQYHYRENIDASLAKMIRTYLALYRVTGCPLDLAKARSLGDALVRAQQPDGRIPTVLTVQQAAKGGGNDWINCMIASYGALDELSGFE